MLGCLWVLTRLLGSEGLRMSLGCCWVLRSLRPSLRGLSRPRGVCPSAPAAATAAKSLQSCPTLCDPMDGSPPGSSIHGVFQTRVLKWGAIAFSFSACSVPQLRQLGSRPWRCCFRGSAASPGRLCFLKPSFAVVCGAPLLANAEPLCLTFSKINSFLLSGVLLSGISSNC